MGKEQQIQAAWSKIAKAERQEVSAFPAYVHQAILNKINKSETDTNYN